MTNTAGNGSEPFREPKREAELMAERIIHSFPLDVVSWLHTYIKKRDI